MYHNRGDDCPPDIDSVSSLVQVARQFPLLLCLYQIQPELELPSSHSNSFLHFVGLSSFFTSSAGLVGCQVSSGVHSFILYADDILSICVDIISDDIYCCNFLVVTVFYLIYLIYLFLSPLLLTSAEVGLGNHGVTCSP